MLNWASETSTRFAVLLCLSNEMSKHIRCGWNPLSALTAFPGKVIATQHFLAIITEIPFQTGVHYLLFVCHKYQFFLTFILNSLMKDEIWHIPLCNGENGRQEFNAL
jgi:hypothetical protein